MSEKTAKYTGQDTVFRDMFSQKKYLLQLYLQRSGLYGAWR